MFPTPQLREDYIHPSSVPPILPISLVWTKELVPHLSALYISVHQIVFSLVQAYICFLCMTFRAMYLSPQYLRGTEHCLTCPSLGNSMVSHSENPLIRQCVHLTTAGLAKYVGSCDWQFQQLHIRWREVKRNGCYCTRKGESRGCWICSKKGREKVKNLMRKRGAVLQRRKGTQTQVRYCGKADIAAERVYTSCACLLFSPEREINSFTLLLFQFAKEKIFFKKSSQRFWGLRPNLY